MGARGEVWRRVVEWIPWRRKAKVVPEGPVKLVALKHAATPPEIDRRWWWACWWIFGAGVVVVLTTLAALAIAPIHVGQAPGWVRIIFLVVLFVIFTAAAVNTFIAANCFDRREKDLQRWFREQSVAMPTPLGGYIPDGTVEGKGRIEATSGAVWDSDATRSGSPSPPLAREWNFHTAGVYVPNPYRMAGNRARLGSTLKEYFDLIHSEVVAARTKAAGMAAALGGVFVAGLQVYGKVFT